MADTATQISELLHEAGETHRRVYRIVDGADDDWASWYGDWLVRLSELPDLLGTTPVRSELVYMLVRLDKEYGGLVGGLLRPGAHRALHGLMMLAKQLSALRSCKGGGCRTVDRG